MPRYAPADMKASVLAAVAHIESTYSPTNSDAWPLAPADTPRLATPAIDAVLGAYDAARPTAMAPTFAGRRGHPLLMPWSAASEVAKLQSHEGVNALAARLPVREVAWPDDSILHDVDTPADVARIERNKPPTSGA